MSVTTNSIVNKETQAGQALPLGIALLLFGTLFAIVLFNTGQLTTEKSRLANAADAAAYSGLVWQARALNFNAYTNRAMVANQVSIAQFVSLNSWSRYALDVAEQADNTIGLIPPVKPYTQAIHSYAETANTVVGELANIAVPLLSGVTEVLSQAQEAVYYASFLATPQIVKDVAKANSERYQVDSDYALVSLADSFYEWKNFTKRYGDEDNKEGIPRKVKVIENSLDDFSKARNWDLGKFYLSATERVELVKEGGTRLQEKDGEYVWLAKDGLSLHWENYRCSWRKGCRWRPYEVGVGGGGAYASDDICSNDSQSNRDSSEDSNAEEENHKCTFFVRNEQAEKRADDRMEEINGYEGIKAYRDLTDLSEANKDPKLHLRVKVHINQQHVKTAAKIASLGSKTIPSEAALKHGVGPGLYWVGDETAGDVMASVSSAELYYKRPDDDKRLEEHKEREYGNLFNPYWQVRLTNTSKIQQLAAWATQDDRIPGARSGLSSGLASYGRQQQQELNHLTELRNYNAQQTSDLSELVASQEQLGSALQSVDNQIALTEATIVELESAGENDDAMMAANLTELQILQEQRAELTSQFDAGSQALSVVQDAQLAVTSLDQQIADYSADLPSVTSNSVLQELADSFAEADDLYHSFDTAAAETQIGQLGEFAQGQLDNGMADLIEEELQAQISAAVEVIGEQDLQLQGISFPDPELKASYEVRAEEYQKFSEAVDDAPALAQQMVGDIAAWIDDDENGMSSEEENTEAMVALAMQEAIDEAKVLIEKQEEKRDAEISSVVNALNKQIASYQDKIDNYDESTHSPADKARWEERLSSRIDELATRPAAIKAEYQARIDEINQEIDAFLDTHDTKSARVRSELTADISKLKSKFREIVSG